MRKKWKEYRLEPQLDKMPAEWKVQAYYHFVGQWNPDAHLILTMAGYNAIMKKDGKHFAELWEYVGLLTG